MSSRWLRLAGAGLVTFLALGSLPATAHQFPLSTVMNALVKIEPTQAHLVLRVPLSVLASDMSRVTVAFPVIGPEIDLAAAGPAIQEALGGLGQEIALWEDGVRLVPSHARGRLSLPSDRSFEQYDQAAAHVAQPMAPGERIYQNQGFFDAQFTYPIGSPTSRFAIQMTVAPGLPEEYLKLVVRYLPLDEGSRAFVISNRSGRVNLNPAWYQAARGFVALGIGHILSGVDHLLFLLCLIIPFRRLRGLIPVVTAFTVAHSITLIASAYDLVPVGAWFPPLVETLIAASIVYMALENIVVTDLRYRWLITGLFGLMHGFGFSYGLAQNLQFAGSHLLVSLLSFNIGIEIGQILMLLVALPALALLFRYALTGRAVVVILSAVAAHTGWHWMTERADVLWKVQWPALDAAGLTVLARWALVVLLAGGGAWLLAGRLVRHPDLQKPRTQVEELEERIVPSVTGTGGYDGQPGNQMQDRGV
ncbi:MAG: HupE/UreJ family protein [Nitrospirota bacterium]